jgi:glycosyltransferase involved in cell wall biosynthesis
MEALGAGLPAICRDHAGARQIIRSDFGFRVADPSAFLQALDSIVSDEAQMKAMGRAASAWAAERPFPESAARLAEILR